MYGNPITLTADDIIRAGACVEGTYNVINRIGESMPAAMPLKLLLRLLTPSEKEYVYRAVDRSCEGYGHRYSCNYGNGNGYGYDYVGSGADGYGDCSYGDGDGYGDSDSDSGSGNYFLNTHLGNGYGDGDGYGESLGCRDGSGCGGGNCYGDGEDYSSCNDDNNVDGCRDLQCTT